MGNKESQSASNNCPEQKSTVDTFTSIRTWLKEGYKLAIKRAGDQPENGLSRQGFQAAVFPSCSKYGDLLYSFMSGEKGRSQVEGQPRSGLTEDEYAEAGLELLQLTSTSQQLQTYFKVFCHGEGTLYKLDGALMLEVCCRLAWQSAGLSAPTVRDDDPTITAIMSSLFGREDGVDWEGFSRWCGRHCSNIFMGVHHCTTQGMLGEASPNLDELAMGDAASDEAGSDLLRQVSEGHGSVTLVTLWSLAATLPTSYFPSIVPGTNTATTVNSNLAIATCPVGWTCLYDSNEQGLSVNRFQHHVFEYKGATLTFVTFQDHIFCIASDTEWKESRQRWGGRDCCLIQVQPKYCIMQEGEAMLYLNFGDRTAPRCLQVGKDPKTIFIQVDAGLSKVTHYGLQCDLHRIEVWGCAGLETREAQQKQKLWEQTQVQKSKDRKIKVDDWKDNPDRQILEMGGVTTEHAQR